MYCYSVSFSACGPGVSRRGPRPVPEMMERSRSSGTPPRSAPALGFEAMLCATSGDHEAAIRSADRLIAMATEQKLYLWMAISSCVAQVE